jgi:glycosyltransferase involved in cell wall biosynthesis
MGTIEGTSNQMRINITLPVYNEEKDLAKSCMILSDFLSSNCPWDWQIVIADNASTDRTPEIARKLAASNPRIQHLRLDMKGRGRALRQAWLNSDADIVSYMDIDLSTDLKSFMPMIGAIASGSADVAIGSRFAKGSEIDRSLKREVLSRTFITLIKAFFPRSTFADAQCGFKAVSRRAVQQLVPMIKNQGWFFDTELLLLADHHGFKIREIPVRWIEDPDSRVRIIRTGLEHSLGVLRMRLTFLTGWDLGEFYSHPVRAERTA